MSTFQSMHCMFLVIVLVCRAYSFSTNDPVLQKVLNINPGSPKTRGSKFAIAFTNNHVRPPTTNQISLFITTEQERSAFSIQTRFAGVAGQGFFTTSLDSGIYSRTEVARRGSFTFISLPAGVNGVPNIAVKTNGTTTTDDRQKGVIVEAADPTDELTVYVFNDAQTSSDAYMALSCVEFPATKNYQYFVFSSDGDYFESQFLITPCEDNTRISVRLSHSLTHPNWVLPSVAITKPTSITKSVYGRLFNRFDTVMLSSTTDLTGSIITSNKPLSVFVGHQCGAPGGTRDCNYLVEQVPPHPTYGDLFFMAPFSVRETGGIYRIGSVTDGSQVTINCDCLVDSGSGNRVALQSKGIRLYSATVNRGQYVQCRTPGLGDAQNYCCVQSSQPVTTMSYTLGHLTDSLPSLPNPPTGGPAMVYIPPATSYLNSYILTTAENMTTPFKGYLSYILPVLLFNNSSEDKQRFTVNNEPFLPPEGYEPIRCNVGNSTKVCAYGATGYIGHGNFEIGYKNIEAEAFWGFTYGYAQDVSYAYPLAFEMEPIGLAWIIAKNTTILEASITVDLGFRISRGDQSVRTRAFAYTDGGSATPGIDYLPVGVRPGKEKSNLRFPISRSTPRNPFIVTIISNPEPEPVETVQVQVECENRENCFLPMKTYFITIIDPQGACSDLPSIANGVVNYNYHFEPPFPKRPYGTVASYTCSDGFVLTGSEKRTCKNGVWNGTNTSCNPGVIWIAAQNITVLESDITVDLGFRITTTGTVLESTEGPTGVVTGQGKGARDRPNHPFQVTINSNTKAEPVRVMKIQVECGDVEYCDLQKMTYFIEIVDSQGNCSDLPSIDNGVINYNYHFESPFPKRPYGTVASYTCNDGFLLSRKEERTCINGVWRGNEPICILRVFCEELSPITNGKIYYSTDMMPPYSPGTIATYNCNPGYRLTGNETRICMDTGDAWRSGEIFGGVEPKCEPLLNRVIDTITGVPFFTVPLYVANKTSIREIGENDSLSLCFEIHGRADAHYNLISDACVSVNARYSRVRTDENINIIDRVYIRAADASHTCRNIEVSLNQCSASVDGVSVANYIAEGIIVRRYRNRIRIMVPNCQDIDLVMWVFCLNNTFWSRTSTEENEVTFDAEMLRFVIARGLNLNEHAHGILGQFWNIPMQVVPYTGRVRPDSSSDGYYVITTNHPDEGMRQFVGWIWPLTWEHQLEYCLYSGQYQGGPLYEIVDDTVNNGVIFGTYDDYEVDSSYGTDFAYTHFNISQCVSPVTSA